MHSRQAEFALESASRLLKASSDGGLLSSTSIGVANGLVFAGLVGHESRREYTVIGAPVNRAARLLMFHSTVQ